MRLKVSHPKKAIFTGLSLIISTDKHNQIIGLALYLWTATLHTGIAYSFGMNVINLFRQLNHLRLATLQPRKHRRVAQHWDRLIEEYYKGKGPSYKLTPKRPNLVGQKIIWQYWAQGVKEEKLPEVVRLCYTSINRHRGDYQVIRLSDQTYREYIDLPEVISVARETHPEMSVAYFSDILRLALLSVYGGVWLDSTIFMAGPFEPSYADLEFFMFQRDPAEPRKYYWRSHLPFFFGWGKHFRTNVQNAIIMARPHSEVIQSLMDILIRYWETKEDTKTPPVYLFFRILFDQLVRRQDTPLHNLNCPIVSDTRLEILQRMMKGDWPQRYESPEVVLQRHSLQKLAYNVPHNTFLRLIRILRETGYLPVDMEAPEDVPTRSQTCQA